MGKVKLRFTSSLPALPTIMLVRYYLIIYKLLLESTQTTNTKPYWLYSKDTIYHLGTMPSCCHVFLSSSQTLTGFVNYIYIYTYTHHTSQVAKSYSTPLLYLLQNIYHFIPTLCIGWRCQERGSWSCGCPQSW